MIQKVKSLDIFGRTFSLDTKKGSGSYTTVIGGLLSIMAFIILSIITLVITVNYKDTTKPVVSAHRVKLERPQKIDLFTNKIISLFGLLDVKFLTKEELRSYVTYRIEMVTTKMDEKGNLVDEVQQFEAEIVEKLKNQKMKELATEVIVNNNIDLDFFASFANVGFIADVNPEEFHINGNKLKLPYRRFRMRFFPCSLPNPSDCVPVQNLAQSQFGNTIYSKVGNYSDKKNPVLPFSDIDNVIYLGLTETVVLSIYLKENLIYDDDMGLVSERLRATYVDVDKAESVSKTRLSGAIHCTVEEIDGGRCEPYLEVIWKSSSEKMIIKRKYITIFDVISEVGGFWDLIRFVVLVFYFYYNTRSYTRFIKSQLVDGYIELDKSRHQDAAQRIYSPALERKIREKLMNENLEKQESPAQQLSFQEIFSTKIDLKKVVELSFKSKVISELFLKGLIFHPAILRIALKKKLLQMNKTETIIGKDFFSLQRPKKVSIIRKRDLEQPSDKELTNQGSTKVFVRSNDSLRKKVLFKNMAARKKLLEEKSGDREGLKAKGALIVIEESQEILEEEKSQEKSLRSINGSKLSEGDWDEIRSEMSAEENFGMSNMSPSGKRFTPMSLRRLSSQTIKKEEKINTNYKKSQLK